MFVKDRGGFTLIELLAVIVILAIILAIAVPAINGVIKNSTKSSFESDAKLLLKAIDYKLLENDSFNPSELNVDTLNSLLGLSPANYENINVKVEGKIVSINIVGKGKWAGLFACGASNNVRVVEQASDCGTDLVLPVINLNGNDTISMVEGDTYSDLGATATDNIDGNITNKIIVTGSVNPNVAGIYTITYKVVDTSGNTATKIRSITILANYAGPKFVTSKNVNGPVLSTGMTPIKWDGSSWVTTTTTDTDWYDYNTTDKKWANARTADGSMWVWVPRYIYKISSGWHTATAGIIEAQFSKGTDDNWNSSVIGNIDTGATSNSSNNKWTNHLAFTFGSTQLTGIWVAKFEATAAEGVANGYYSDWSCPNAGDDVTTKTVKSIPNAMSWRCQTIEKAFTVSRNMEKQAAFGWGTNGTDIDTHLMKNTEWGAITYLSKSSYGNNEEVWINNSQTFTTGCAGNSQSAAAYAGCQNTYNTANGVKSSATGNIYGVYDMSGGALDRVAAYVANNNSNLTTYGATLISSNVIYKDLYEMGTTDTGPNNYALLVNKKGDALYETSSNTDGVYSWFSDYSYAPTSAGCFVGRGGYFGAGTANGLFSSTRPDGAAFGSNGFRPVLVVGSGL